MCTNAALAGILTAWGLYIFLGRFPRLLVSHTFISPRKLGGACIPFHLLCVCCAAVLCIEDKLFFLLNFLSGWNDAPFFSTQRRPWMLYAKRTPQLIAGCVWNEFTVWCARRLFAPNRIYTPCHAHFLLAGPWEHTGRTRGSAISPPLCLYIMKGSTGTSKLSSPRLGAELEIVINHLQHP